jgi:hypothetical protein
MADTGGDHRPGGGRGRQALITSERHGHRQMMPVRSWKDATANEGLVYILKFTLNSTM